MRWVLWCGCEPAVGGSYGQDDEHEAPDLSAFGEVLRLMVRCHVLADGLGLGL